MKIKQCKKTTNKVCQRYRNKNMTGLDINTYLLQRLIQWKSELGIRPKYSTCTELSTITAVIATGFSGKQPAQRSVLVEFDLTAAFAEVGHQQLLDCVYNTNLPATIRRWLDKYMLIRRAKVPFRQQESNRRKVKIGVEQGGVLLPALFHCHLADFPTPPLNTKLMKYAEAITICSSVEIALTILRRLTNFYIQIFY